MKTQTYEQSRATMEKVVADAQGPPKGPEAEKYEQRLRRLREERAAARAKAPAGGE